MCKNYSKLLSFDPQVPNTPTGDLTETFVMVIETLPSYIREAAERSLNPFDFVDQDRIFAEFERTELPEDIFMDTREWMFRVRGRPVPFDESIVDFLPYESDAVEIWQRAWLRDARARIAAGRDTRSDRQRAVIFERSRRRRMLFDALWEMGEMVHVFED